MTEQALFEYHLYTLERPTTIADNQTKQVALLSGSGIPVTKEYRFVNIANAYDYIKAEAPRANADVHIAFENNEAAKLGLPLPQRVMVGLSESLASCVLRMSAGTTWEVSRS